MHELVHVLWPNGNRLLAEGLAVHLQAEIGGNPAFPNFGRPLHQLVCERLCELIPASPPTSLDAVRIADLDAIATPAPLGLTIGDHVYGEGARGQSIIYAGWRLYPNEEHPAWKDKAVHSCGCGCGCST